MTLEQRITILEKRLDGYIGSQNIKAKYDSYDKDGLRHTDSLNAEGIAEVKSIDGREFNPERLNHSGDIVLWHGSFARCLHDNKGITPDNKIYWELLTVSDAILELIDRVSKLEQEE